MTIQAGLIPLVPGETFSKGWTWLDNDRRPVNLTGASARLVCRAYGKPKPLFAFDNTPGLGEGQITLGAEAGTIDVTMDRDLTALLTQGGPFSLFVRLAGGQTVHFAEGAIQVKVPGVRHA